MDLFRKLKLKYLCSDKKELFDHDYVIKHEYDMAHHTYMDTFEKSYLKIRSASDINAAYAILALCNTSPLQYSTFRFEFLLEIIFTSFVSLFIRMLIIILPIITSSV